MCVRACVCLCIYIHIYKYAYIHRCTHTHIYICTHTHKITPTLSGWDHTWERETYPLIPYFMDHYRGFVGGVFFTKQITGENKNLQTVQAFGDLSWLKGE